MAASVVGAFTIIDRASRPIKNIRQEAIKTDAAIRKLGANLDRIGTREQRNQMQQTVTQMRKVSKESGTAAVATRTLKGELDKVGAPKVARDLSRTAEAVKNTGRAAEDTDKTVGDMTKSVGKLRNESERTRGSLDKLYGKVASLGVLMKVALVPAVGLAVQGIASLGVGIASLLPKLTSLGALMAPLGAGILGIGTAALTVKLAMGGMSKAMGGNEKALKALTPQAREFVRTLKEYKPLIDGLRRSAQAGLFPGLDLAIRRLAAAAPVVRQIMRQMGSAVGDVAGQGAGFLTRKGFLGDIQMLTGQGGDLIRRGARALENVADAIRHILVPAMPFVDWLSKTVVGWTSYVKNAALAGRETGRIAEWFVRARIDLQQLGRIAGNVFGGLRATFQELRPLGQLLWSGIERITQQWSAWAQSTRGRADMRSYFASMAPAFKQIVGLAGDLAKGLGTLSQGSGFADAIRSLRAALPSLTAGLNAMATGLGPAVVGALAAVVRTFSLLAQNGGALATVVRLFGALAGGVNWLLENIPHLGQVLGTALAVGGVMRLSTALTGLVGKWRNVGAAAATAAAEEAAAGGGAGTTVATRGRGGVRGRLPALTTGRGVLLAGTAATIAGQAIGGTGGGVLSGAGTGAALGSMAGPEGALIGAGLGGLVGFLSSRGQGARDATARGQDAAVTLLASGAQTNQVSGRVQDLQSRLSARTPVDPIQRGYSVLGQPTPGRVPTRLAITGDDRKRLQAELDALKPELKVRIQIRHQEAVARAQAAGQLLARQLGQAYNVYDRKFGMRQAMQMTTDDVVKRMRTLGPHGRSALATNVLSWASQMARDNPKLKGPVEELRATITAQFKALGEDVKIINGRILTGSQGQWASIRDSLTGPVEEARQKVSAGFTAMQREAVGALTMMGFTRSQARQIVSAQEQGGTKAANMVQTGATNANVYGGANKKNAQGGRIPGVGLSDTVMVAPGQMAAPGELIVNRHTEARVNRKLATFGTSLGREVGGETRPHYASAAASGGGGLHAGIASGVRAVLAQFPGLSVTSTTGGGHAKNSYHYRGMAADIGGGTALMNRAAAWIGTNMGGSLLEGIHNPNLSIKNGRTVGAGTWGSSVWAQHLNHIHMAMADSAAGAFSGLATGDGSGVGSVSLKRRRTGVGGAAGMAGDRVLASGAAALEASLNGRLGGGAAPGAPGGGGTAGANQKLGKSMMLAGGWGAGQWPALKALWQRESGWSTTARNPSSGAFGIPQALGHGAIGNSASQQISWGLNYIRGRYGSPNAAWAHEQSAGWYGMGGRLPDWGGWHAKGGRKRFTTPTIIGVGDRPEDVSITPAGKGGGPTVQINLGGVTIQGVSAKAADEFVDLIMDKLSTALRRAGMQPEGAMA